ncbi:PREDICTED: pathogenesis-related homeodomain protein isoform X2 [Tarenaya hassleriana]|uniref:pathogenesis-related homeodomain protein isoform X2 n=1 Tax=Tarenaya hassleriana TaxID=28532 RepID=UPI00053C5A9C|nr:PREDICTED: pathogenesis-related homeodomain protein isoform X2 [Tarenaya hassleriana]
MQEGEIREQIDREPEKFSIGETGSMLSAPFAKAGRKIANRRKNKQKRKTNAEKSGSISSRKKASGAAFSSEKKSSRVHSKDADGEGKAKKARKRKQKRQRGKVEPDEGLRLQRRTRYLLIKMKLEQNLIDAYSGEGWKGQSREKIRPDKELERARKQILKCKLGIRDAIHELDMLSSVGSIEEKVIAPDGSVHHEHIFCAKCSSREAFLDNDIILCDGTCNRAFHQKCLEPPLETESIPPGDQSWFCKLCICKMEIIDSMNAHIGTHFPVDSNWKDIFKEEAGHPNGSDGQLKNGEDWPSDDSEDDDYDPEMREQGSDMSGVGSGGDDGESISTSLSWSSGGVALSSGSGRWGLESDNISHAVGHRVDSGETSNEDIVCGPRQRRAVDYRKLYDEMFGKDALLHEQFSEDEDWGPKHKRRRKKESDAASTLVTLFESNEKDPNVETTMERERLSADIKEKPASRLPRDAVELRKVFTENELPSKSVRDNLSKELDLEPDKVSEWFKNARFMAMKSRKTESTKPAHGSTVLSEGPEPGAIHEKHEETNEPRNTFVETVSYGSKDLENTSLSNRQKSSEQVAGQVGVDISLKKHTEEKNREGKTTEHNQEFETEMERLCRTQNKIQDMKSRLSRFRRQRGRKKLGKSSCLLEENSIVYVPIAEIKEKELDAAV